MKVSPLSCLLYAFALCLLFHSQPSGPNPIRPPASSFIICDSISSIATATEAFNRYSAIYPEVTRQNVNGPEGQDFRDALMQCPRVCLMPLGSGNPDITGIGGSLTLSLVVLYLLTRFLRCLARYLGCAQTAVNCLHHLFPPSECTTSPNSESEALPNPKSEPEPDSESDSESVSSPNSVSKIEVSDSIQSIYRSFYDTSLTFATSLVCSVVYWSSRPDVFIFQALTLHFAAAISFGTVIITYTIIGRHLPHPTLRFLATLPTFVVFLFVFAVSHAEHKIAAEVLPFYQTLGADCPGREYMQKELLVPFLSTDKRHILLMSSLAVFMAYWLVHSLHRIYLRHPKLRDFIVKRLDLMYKKNRFQKASMSISKLCHNTLAHHPRNDKPLKKISKNFKPRSDISKSLKAAIKFLGRILLRLLYLAIIISGVHSIYRLFRLRDVYSQWQARVVAEAGNTTSTTTTWDDNQWGVGQIVALFVWYQFLGEFGLRVLDSGWRKVVEMARSHGSIGTPSPPARP